MYQVKYQEVIYTGNTEKELLLKLRKARLPLKRIGSLMGYSRQRVTQIIGSAGHLEYPELDKPETFNETDEVVALRLGLVTSKVSAARRKLGLKAPLKVNIDLRRKNLAKILFNKEPGPEFAVFIEKQLEQLHAGRARVLREFYIEGKAVSSAEGTDTDRTYRAIAKQKLCEIVSKYDVEQLIKEGVLNE